MINNPNPPKAINKLSKYIPIVISNSGNTIANIYNAAKYFFLYIIPIIAKIEIISAQIIIATLAFTPYSVSINREIIKPNRTPQTPK